MSTLAENAKAIFLQAVEKEPEDWTAFLGEACGDDEKLRQRVQGLLQAFNYLNQLQLHASDVAEHPERWMPWNYQDALASC